MGLFLPHLVFPPFFLVLVATRWPGGRVPVRVSGWCFFVGGAQAAGALGAADAADGAEGGGSAEEAEGQDALADHHLLLSAATCRATTNKTVHHHGREERGEASERMEETESNKATATSVDGDGMTKERKQVQSEAS